MIPKNEILSDLQTLRLNKALSTFLKILEDVEEKENLKMSAIISIAYIDEKKYKIAEIGGTNTTDDNLLAKHFMQSETLTEVNQRVAKQIIDL